MTKSMLVDATHAEETRTAVVDNGRIMDFDYESNIRQQLKGSIFLAKVTRVEPSLQASFVNFGGERHGFLPFNEIHPDYFRIPISDREAIIEEQKAYMDALAAQEEAADLEEEQEEASSEKNKSGKGGKKQDTSEEPTKETSEDKSDEDVSEKEPEKKTKKGSKKPTKKDAEKEETAATKDTDKDTEDAPVATNDNPEDTEETDASDDTSSENSDDKQKNNRGRGRGRGRGKGRGRAALDSRKVEIVGGDIVEGEHTPRPTLRKNYKIQEVVKRSQIMLVQAQKEERGNKGAAVTTYISLPGRYCVLMPNSPRGGGVSRKIANYKERKRMREILKELNVPEGMSVILRTAGVSRTKADIKRDLDYLMRLWDDIRALTLESIAPACVYEEGNLIKRGIRDIYTRDVEEIVIAGETAFKEAKKFMKMLIPSHAKKVIEYTDEKIPLFHKYKIENQIVEMGVPEAGLKSGGSIVINPTEALVAIDVNSGRATKERHIEETALRTNLEAAEEVARQLKLRDLGGLIVIDFIDMENYRNNAKVERRLKECLSGDRARIQIGRISSFGLLELSRQRLNPSMTEAQFKLCESCKGLGYTRTTDSTAVIALRTVEEQAINFPNNNSITLTVNNKVALYILNNKRDLLSIIESRHNCKVALQVDDSLAPAAFLINDKAPVIAKSDDKQKPQRNNRNRNRNRNNKNKQNDNAQKDNQEQNQAQNPNTKKPSEDKPSTPSEGGDNAEVASDQKPKRRRGRRPAQNKNNEASNNEAPSDTKTDESKNTAPKSDTADKVENKVNDKASDGTEAKKKTPKRAPRKKAPAKEASKESAKDQDNKPAKEETPKKSANAEVKVVTAVAKTKEAPSPEPVVNKDYETVNEAPKKKKRGWWSKG